MADVRACSLCQYFTPGASRGECRRYPVVAMKHEAEWCGEFAARVEPPRGKRLREPARSWDANGSPVE